MLANVRAEDGGGSESLAAVDTLVWPLAAVHLSRDTRYTALTPQR